MEHADKVLLGILSSYILIEINTNKILGLQRADRVHLCIGYDIKISLPEAGSRYWVK